MKLLLRALLVAGALFGLCAGSAFAAASTTRTLYNINDSFSESDNCGFELDWNFQGSVKATDYFDTSGTLVKEIDTITGGPFTLTVINPASGKTAITRSQTVVGIFTFNPDGSINTEAANGIVFHFILPGTGVIAADVGSVVVDSEGNIVRIGGPHQFLTGDLAGFCAAIA
jgi:hypothetical protein